ncbi:uncharacterized protein LOC115603511 isoform X1 [Strigops habroptila]|uniref:uncharacterized protein LOC115603511 isoform X1 n=1 Tax=Strigops habroptila TaxID=2489341 RepID=UPI00140408F6|nr:uncharacterized protein LOC115603511 isoform X1 [Strigops habroptila]
MMPRVLFKRAGGGVSSILSAQPRGAGSAPAMEPLSPPPAPDEETPPRLTPPRPPGPAQGRTHWCWRGEGRRMLRPDGRSEGAGVGVEGEGWFWGVPPHFVMTPIESRSAEPAAEKQPLTLGEGVKGCSPSPTP